MKPIRIVLIIMTLLVCGASAAVADDFDWIRNFNIQAQADPSGFRARLATRFKIGDAQVDAVISNVRSPADAYIALRLGEISGRPVEYVLGKYDRYEGKGWGALAKSLGIKPGSEEFHALKRGHDPYGGNDRIQAFFSVNSHGNGRDGAEDHGKGKGKGKKQK